MIKTSTKTLRDLFLEELADIYDAERRIVRALPKVAKAATCDGLKGAIQAHLVETEGHVKKLEQVFELFGVKAKGQTCKATIGLLQECEEITVDFKGSPALNAALISATQKVEHYEIASYGCLHEWAALLGNKQAAALLQEALDQEQAANDGLTQMARTTCNREGLGEPNRNGFKAKSEAARRPLSRDVRPGTKARTLASLKSR